jgi:ubiquinone/menaquinone biosynthesis C-methylase UbiE
MVDRNLNYGREVIVNMLRSLKIAPKKILDIGVGQGFDLENIGNIFPNASLHGVDENNRKISLSQNKSIQCFKVDLEIESMPFNDESYNLIISNQTLEHVKNVHHVVSELVRLTEVDGYFLIGVPNLGSLHNRLLLLFGRQPTCMRTDSGHVRGFTNTELIDFVLKISGNSVNFVERRGSNFYPFPRFLAIILSKFLPSLSVTSFFLFKKTKSYNFEHIKHLISHPFETNYFLSDESR